MDAELEKALKAQALQQRVFAREIAVGGLKHTLALFDAVNAANAVPLASRMEVFREKLDEQLSAAEKLLATAEAEYAQATR